MTPRTDYANLSKRMDYMFATLSMMTDTLGRMGDFEALRKRVHSLEKTRPRHTETLTAQQERVEALEKEVTELRKDLIALRVVLITEEPK